MSTYLLYASISTYIYLLPKTDSNIRFYNIHILLSIDIFRARLVIKIYPCQAYPVCRIFGKSTLYVFIYAYRYSLILPNCISCLLNSRSLSRLDLLSKNCPAWRFPVHVRTANFFFSLIHPITDF